MPQKNGCFFLQVKNKQGKTVCPDVFWELEEVLIKKDLDTDGWNKIPRSKALIKTKLGTVYSDVVQYLMTEYNISEKNAVRCIKAFEKDI